MLLRPSRSDMELMSITCLLQYLPHCRSSWGCALRARRSRRRSSSWITSIANLQGTDVLGYEQTAGFPTSLRTGSSTSPLAIKLREASVRMTLLIKPISCGLTICLCLPRLIRVRPARYGCLNPIHRKKALLMPVGGPVEVLGTGFMNRRGDSSKVGRNVVLESVLADVAQ